MKALSNEKIRVILGEAGFAPRRSGLEWVRESDHFVDVIDIQYSKSLERLTVNVSTLNKAIRSIIDEVTPESSRVGSFYTISTRLGQLIDGKDRWWNRRNTDGILEICDAIKTRALPFLERMHSLEGLRDYLAPEGGERWGNVTPRLDLAVILSQLGEIERACELLNNPTRRLLPQELAKVQAVKRRLCEELPGRDDSALQG